MNEFKVKRLPQAAAFFLFFWMFSIFLSFSFSFVTHLIDKYKKDEALITYYFWNFSF